MTRILGHTSRDVTAITNTASIAGVLCWVKVLEKFRSDLVLLH